jgi:hypothetical protein
MKALPLFFKVLGHIWMALFVIAFIVSIIGMFLAEPSFYHGWKRVTATLSPFNIANWIVTVVCILPGIGFYKASEYFERKVKQSPNKGMEPTP